jgi:hypothetical protein
MEQRTFANADWSKALIREVASLHYTTLSLGEVASALRDVAVEAQTAFGNLDARQLNWKPGAERWSVAQCVQHLLTANQLIVQKADDALRNGPRTVWQRVPLLPRLWGLALIRSQAPGVTRKYVAPVTARPTASAIPGDIIQHFADQHRAIADAVQGLSERDAARAIMVSPFIRVVTYSVLDAYRLVAAHDHRHLAQARRVMTSPGFGG